MVKQRIMALDVGDAAVGVALSDPLGFGAHPQPAIERSKSGFLQQLLKLALENDVAVIVVGLPLKMSGERSEQTEKVQLFIEKLTRVLAESSKIQVETWDERLTTVQAERIMQGSKLKNKKKSRALDSISASLILESYMAAKAG